ncbi:MAG: NUDIX domain-containing protein, partial [Cytophagaceae bacterium]
MTQVLDKPRQEVITLYGNRLRLRVCGLYCQKDQLLMVRHRGIGPTDTFWCPPGGGAQFGEAAPDALIREFAEETGLDVQVGELLFVNEFMQPPLHALELFFRVDALGGQLLAGTDPEMSPDGQIIYNSQGYPVLTEEAFYLGRATPDFNWGFSNNFRYKQWRLKVLVDGQYGAVAYSHTLTKSSYSPDPTRPNLGIRQIAFEKMPNMSI